MELQNPVLTPTDVSPLLGSASECQGDAPDLASPESADKRVVSEVELQALSSENTYARASEDQLFRAAKSADGRAFEELSGRHLGFIRKRVYSIVRNPEDTEDVVQDSLLKAYCHLHEFRESCSFSTWLTRIAINAALMLLRKKKKRAEVPFDQGGEADQAWSTWEIPDPSPDAEWTYATQETLEFMSRAVKSLPPLYRSVLEQYHAQEKSLREAADKLGITVASAKARLFRARRTLRSRLERLHISAFEARY